MARNDRAAKSAPARRGSVCNGAGVFEPEAPAASSLSNAQRQRIAAGKLQRGDVAAVRLLLGLTQARFARGLGISKATLQNWEQQRTTPNGAALALLRIAARHPAIVRELISTIA